MFCSGCQQRLGSLFCDQTALPLPIEEKWQFVSCQKMRVFVLFFLFGGGSSIHRPGKWIALYTTVLASALKEEVPLRVLLLYLRENESGTTELQLGMLRSSKSRWFLFTGLLLKIGRRSRRSFIGSQSDACHCALTGKENVRSEVSRKRRSRSKREPKRQHQQHKTNREGTGVHNFF